MLRALGLMGDEDRPAKAIRGIAEDVRYARPGSADDDLGKDDPRRARAVGHDDRESSRSDDREDLRTLRDRVQRLGENDLERMQRSFAGEPEPDFVPDLRLASPEGRAEALRKHLDAVALDDPLVATDGRGETALLELDA
jgi:hypothetical protein